MRCVVAVSVVSLALNFASAHAAVRLRSRTIASSSEIAELAATGDPATIVIAASGPVTADWVRSIWASGGRIVSYLPDAAFLVRVPHSRLAAVAGLSGTGLAAPYLPGDKIAPELAPALAAATGRLPVHILVAPDTSAAVVASTLTGLGLVVAGSGDGGSFNDLTAFLPAVEGAALAGRVAELPDVLWIEPRARRVLLNDTGIWVGQGGNDGREATPIFDHGIYGTGQTVAVLDTGLDYDMCYFRDDLLGPPPVNTPGGLAFDPGQRKVVAYDMLWTADDPADSGDYDNHGHGTHVCGTVGGDQGPSPAVHDLGDGMAPAAQLVMQDGGYASGDDCADLPGLGCPVVDLMPLFDQTYRQGARLHSNSWGDRENFTPQNTYTAACVDTDEFMYDHPDFLIIYAAGNSGPGPDSVGSPSTAKNTVAVGATNRGSGSDTIAGFSSRGSAADGRLKPTITAPGVGIVSAANDGDTGSDNCGTTGMSGTSMACPTAAGLTALAREYYTAGFYPTGVRTPADALMPSAALLKATIVNSGRQMTGESEIPSIVQGWGRVTLGDTLWFPGNDKDLFVVDDKAGFATGATAAIRYTVEVLSADFPLKATLVWTDRPSNPSAAVNLVNDLDLSVSGPSGTFLGNVWSGGRSQPGGSADRLNVEEQVLIAAPTPGTYTIDIAPASIPMGPQPFALVVTADLPTPLNLAYLLHTAVSDENGNGWADPGETVQLAVTLHNPSDATATAVSARLVSPTTDATVVDADATYPDMPGGASATSIADHYEIRIADTAPCGGSVVLQLQISAGGSSFAGQFELMVGGLGVYLADRFDAIAEGTQPPGWTIRATRPAFVRVAADASVEPVLTSPGPPSPPHALVIGKTDDAPNFTVTTAVRQLDLSAFVGSSAPIVVSFDWWAYRASGGDFLDVRLSDRGPSLFEFPLVTTPTPFDSATDGGNLWAHVAVDATSLVGFDPGLDVHIRFEARVRGSEAVGSIFYIDNLEVRAPVCEPVGGCTGVVADASATDVTARCPNTATTLDGSRSLVPDCVDPRYDWFDGPFLLGRGVTTVAYPVPGSIYTLEVECLDPPSCTATTTVGIPVLPASSSNIVANSLRAVGDPTGAALLSWGGSGGGFNVAANGSRVSLPFLYGSTPLNPSPLSVTAYTDRPVAPLTYYRAFGINDCNGHSVP